MSLKTLVPCLVVLTVGSAAPSARAQDPAPASPAPAPADCHRPALTACGPSPAEQRHCECGQQLWDLKALTRAGTAGLDRCPSLETTRQANWCTFLANEVEFIGAQAAGGEHPALPAAEEVKAALTAAQATPLPDKAPGTQGGS